MCLKFASPGGYGGGGVGGINGCLGSDMAAFRCKGSEINSV